jgi:hypothetical protein
VLAAKTQQATNKEGNPKKIGQGVETIAGDDHGTSPIMIDLHKLQLVSQAKMIEKMITATVDIEATIGMS